MLENKKIAVGTLVSQIQTTYSKQTEFNFPTIVQELLDTKIQKTQIKLIPGTSVLKIMVIFDLQLRYIDAETKMLKTFSQILNFEQFVSMSPEPGSFSASIEEGSLLHINFMPPNLLIVKPQLSLLITKNKNEVLNADILQNSDGSIHIYPAPDGSYSVANVGTVKLRIN